MKLANKQQAITMGQNETFLKKSKKTYIKITWKKYISRCTSRSLRRAGKAGKHPSSLAGTVSSSLPGTVSSSLAGTVSIIFGWNGIHHLWLEQYPSSLAGTVSIMLGWNRKPGWNVSSGRVGSNWQASRMAADYRKSMVLCIFFEEFGPLQKRDFPKKEKGRRSKQSSQERERAAERLML